MAESSLNMTFRRWLDSNQMIHLNRLRIMLQTVNLVPEEEDIPRWIWSRNGKFKVKSIYNHLSDVGPDRSFKHL